MVNLTIDGVPVSVPKGTLLVEAVKKIQQEIPVYCYHPKLGPAGLCRVCLVDIDGMPKLQIGCNTPVAEGMVVRTRGEKVDTGRAMVLELLLVNHPLDCPICDKGGECDLQDYAMAYARGTSDVADAKTSKPKGVDLGPTIVLDEERCVVCQRCVRFDELIVGDQQLVLKDRGHKDMIATATGEPYRHHFTGNVTELCPVGALTSKTYRFKSRPWDLTRTQTSCTQCSVGCRMNADVRGGTLLRTMSVESDDAISDGWLCDRGRYNIGYVDSPERITQPLYRKDGRFVQISWDDAFALWAKALHDAKSAPESIGVIGGGRLLNEEAYILGTLMRAIGVRNLDWRAGVQRQATPGRFAGTFEQLESASVILVIGASPAETAPVLDLRIRKAVRHGGRRFDVNAGNEAAALAEARDARSVALVWDGSDLALGARMHEALAGHAAFSTYISGEQGNARGAEAMGLLPRDASLDGAAIFSAARDGKIRVLNLLGVNPALNFPDGTLVDAALQTSAFTVVTELFMTETAQRATLVLPVRSAFEKSGTIINATGELLPVEAALVAPEGVLSDLEVLVGLAQALDQALPTEEEVRRTVIAAAAQRSEFAFGDARYAWSQAPAPQGPPRHLFAGGGTSAHDVRIAALRPTASLASPVGV
ncbi:MAG: NADH-quinone oxidoreductase subunit G [Vulcanimicrobiaceae bacterium]